MEIVGLLGLLVVVWFFVGWGQAVVEASNGDYWGLFVMGYMTGAILLAGYLVGE